MMTEPAGSLRCPAAVCARGDFTHPTLLPLGTRRCNTRTDALPTRAASEQPKSRVGKKGENPSRHRAREPRGEREETLGPCWALQHGALGTCRGH